MTKATVGTLLRNSTQLRRRSDATSIEELSTFFSCSCSLRAASRFALEARRKQGPFIFLVKSMQRVAAQFGRLTALFRERPLVANMVSYPALYVAAEFSQQTILMRIDESRRRRGYDWKIMLRYMVFATTVSAPFLHYWYRYLDRVIPSRGTKEAIQKALADQAVSSSIILAVFYPAMSAMEGKEDIFAELKAKFVPTYKLSCCFWIPAQCVNFFLVPPHLRVVTVGICSFAWVNILCIMKRMTIKTHEHDA